ncbi:MAG: 4-oxalocrotonate tautomerase family protein [Acidaminococcus sp.]|nr:4-oxalocrotonate tautomerase family protein [Acidaminococcus sp.]MCI2100843.1 4-oxalocrotonate tautomerase family protein [Acidaminococcus sp.]MCI2115206.1 4-oxalocrotonate tautomerase family protein [Acidaminococcus sp.]MCI2116661.1 4-oxalocrotonate tautomerase family protein [Acidaminococcus sp.]
MPHISLTLYKGRKEEDLKAIANELRDSLKKWWPDPEEAVSVSIAETTKEDFVKDVKMKTKNDKLILRSSVIK